MTVASSWHGRVPPPRQKTRPDPAAIVDRLARKLYVEAVEDLGLERVDWDLIEPDAREFYRGLAIRRICSEEASA